MAWSLRIDSDLYVAMLMVTVSIFSGRFCWVPASCVCVLFVVCMTLFGGRQAVEDGVHLNKDSLKELFTALSPPGTVKSPRQPFSNPSDDAVDEDRRRSVREWMEKKKSERMKAFRRKLGELRAAERQPFKPIRKSTKKVSNWRLLLLSAFQTPTSCYCSVSFNFFSLFQSQFLGRLESVKLTLYQRAYGAVLVFSFE